MAATVLQPERGADDWVIVSGAMAVVARFYARYATALAEAGFGAVTYDYRGIGGSRPASLRGFPATMTDWAVLDMTGVTTWVHATQAPRRLFLVGHSLGGILPGLMDCPDLVDAMDEGNPCQDRVHECRRHPGRESCGVGEDRQAGLQTA